MYREADYEMEQLLRSLAKIDNARKRCGRHFESHIWFDDGVRGLFIFFLHFFKKMDNKIKNIKLHIVTDIKEKRKCGYLKRE